MGDIFSSEQKEASQVQQFVNINITVAPGTQDLVVTDGNQRAHTVVTTLPENGSNAEQQAFKAPKTTVNEITKAPIAWEPEPVDEKSHRELGDGSAEPNEPVCPEFAKKEVAPVDCEPKLTEGKDDRQRKDHSAEPDGPVPSEFATTGAAPVDCEPELTDRKDDQRSTDTSATNGLQEAVATEGDDQQPKDDSAEPENPGAHQAGEKKVMTAAMVSEPALADEEDQQPEATREEALTSAPKEPAVTDMAALRVSEHLGALCADVEHLKNRIAEIDAARLTVTSVKEDKRTRAFGAQVEEDKLIVDNALWAACAENAELKLRLAHLENARKPISCSASLQTAFTAADFVKGCHVSSIIVDGRETLDDAWFYRYISADRAGRLYFADLKNHVVRRIDVDGKDSAIAGNGGPGFRDGRRTAAQFCCPMGLDVTADGTIYVADWGNDAVRRIALDGTVSTVAGNGFRGFQNGKGRAALFSDPHDCAVGLDGTVYVADVSNNAIRRVARDGTVTTMAGSGTAGLKDGKGRRGLLNFPASVAVDRDGNVVVADCGNNVIRRIAPNGVVKTLAGNGIPGFQDGTAAEATFRNPNDVAVGADGALYIADSGNRAIRCISPNGMVTTIAGTGTAGYRDGPGLEAKFTCPTGLTVGPDGTIYVMDVVNKRIRRITPGDVQTPVKGG